MLTLRRRASTIDDTRCAMSIVCSSSVSISFSSASGKSARCTDDSVWRPLTAFQVAEYAVGDEGGRRVPPASIPSQGRCRASGMRPACRLLMPPPQKRFAVEAHVPVRERFSPTKSCYGACRGRRVVVVEPARVTSLTSVLSSEMIQRSISGRSATGISASLPVKPSTLA